LIAVRSRDAVSQAPGASLSRGESAMSEKIKRLDFFVPVIERSNKGRVKVGHKWETMKIREVPTKEAGNAWKNSRRSGS
jgi:hypothetical protein